ncbi:MAG: PIG-L family deacetylase [Acidobacteria bacterium]|nr:PIG-L family deacetylase [Acidobacteriota bacterium]
MWDVLARLGVWHAGEPLPSGVVLAAHQDDEVIGASALISGLPRVHIVHVTDGAPRDLSYVRAAGFSTREEYVCVRKLEAANALAVAGLPEDHIERLEFADQEASLDLTGVACRVAAMMTESPADLIATHAYEGGHPDHDATAFAAHAACRLLEASGVEPPHLIEFTGYFECCGQITMGDFLPVESVCVAVLELSESQRDLKRRMRDCYTSTIEVLKGFPLDKELYRVAPQYTFTEPPHRGHLHYERYQWGVTGEQWRHLAREALNTLGIDEPL